MARGSSSNENTEKNKEPLSPLKRLAAARRLEALTSPVSEESLRESATKKADDFYALDWTLGQLTPGSEQYQHVLNAMAPNDLGLTYPREHFLNLLACSLSLSEQEKRRVLTELAIGLTQEQMDALIATFEEERTEFEKIVPKEQKHILPMYLNVMADWATIYMGMGLSSHVMANVVINALGNDNGVIPKVFTRDANFWKVLSDLSIIWGLDDPIIASIIERGIVVGKEEGIERPFIHGLLNYAYRTDLYTLKSPRAYIQRRVGIFSTYARSSLSDDKKSRLIVCRAFIIGICEDYFLLGQVEEARKSIAYAEEVLNSLKAEPDTDDVPLNDIKQTEALLASTELALEAYAEDINLERAADLLKRVTQNSLAETTTNRVLIAFLLMQQGDLCCNLLAAKIEKKEVKQNDVLEAATHLLVFARITSDEDAIYIAKKAFLDILQPNLQKLTHSSQKQDINSLRQRYLETMVFVWLGDGTAEEQELFLHLWKGASRGFHETIRSPNKATKQSPEVPGFKYWIIRSIEQKMNGETPDLMELKKSIKNFWQLYYALIMLYGISFNPKARKHCKDIANTLLSLAENRLFGFPLKDKILFFSPFAIGHHYAGSSSHEIQQWRGQLVFEKILSEFFP